MSLSRMSINASSQSVLQKIDSLQHIYYENFQSEPAFFLRCPGRVNLVGEHLDYNKFPVLPMAIELDIVVAVGPNDDRINIINVDANYPQIAILFNEIPEEADLHDLQWYHYILAGILTIAREYNLSPKLNIVVYGSIPIAAGLSSSSALVCAAAMATVFHYGLHESAHIGKKELAEICATGEHYVGTRGGGMDQAIIFFGQQGYATKIEFSPSLEVTTVRLPREVKFIVAHSGIKVEKASTNVFNKRVAECLLGAKMLAHLSGHDWTNVTNLKQVEILTGKDLDVLLQKTGEEILEAVVTARDVANLMGLAVAELEEILQGFHIEFLEEEEFKLLDRIKHVIRETKNVERFIGACKAKNLLELGEAMNDSHRSLRELYDCSHPRLDDMAEFALQNGALGARLTGAGWGGCIVVAVTKEKSEHVLNALRDYVRELGLPDDSVFLTKPCNGAFIIEKNERVEDWINIDED